MRPVPGAGHRLGRASWSRALDDGRLAGLRGFGPKTEENLRHGIELTRRRRRPGAHRRGHRAGRGDRGRDLGRAGLPARAPTPDRCAGCGRPSATSTSWPPPTDSGPADGGVRGAAAGRRGHRRAGDKKTSVRTTGGLQVDLRVVPLESWGAALQYFTGSKQHNIRIRELAVRKGLKLSEYGLFQRRRRRAGRLGDRGGGVRAARAGLGPADAARGPRRGRRRRSAGTLPDAGHRARTSGATCTRTPT